MVGSLTGQSNPGDSIRIKSSSDEFEQILKDKRNETAKTPEKQGSKTDTVRKVVVIKSSSVQQLPPGSVVMRKPVAIKENYAGFNTAPMLNQFIPFNAIEPSKQLISVNFRKYTNNKGYRLGMGANLEVSGDIQSFAFKYDMDSRRVLSNNLLYFAGYGFGFEYFEDLSDNQGFFFNMNGFVDALAAVHWGIEYQINPMISLSTEASLQLRLGTSGGIRIVPPVSIMANVKIDKLKKN